MLCRSVFPDISKERLDYVFKVWKWRLFLHQNAGKRPVTQRNNSDDLNPKQYLQSRNFKVPCLDHYCFVVKPFCPKFRRAARHLTLPRFKSQPWDLIFWLFSYFPLANCRIISEIQSLSLPVPCKPSAFRKRVRRVINVVNWRESEWVVNYLKSAVNWSEVKCSAVNGVKSGFTVKGIYGWWSKVKWGEVQWSEVKVLLKMVCYTCGLTTLEPRYCSFSPLCCFSCMHFVLICTVVDLYCFVICVCVCACVYVYWTTATGWLPNCS